jgi:hypothetical protein
MGRIALISCASQKLNHKAKAKDIYISALFRYSLKFAERLAPDAIYILSALHHLLELETIIEPYNVTLSYITPKKLKDKNVVVLSNEEKGTWAETVTSQLSKVSDIAEDTFILLAGQSYIRPLSNYLKNIEEPMRGLKQGERISFLLKH